MVLIPGMQAVEYFKKEKKETINTAHHINRLKKKKQYHIN